ncbi:6-phosphogluconolactonase [Thiolapillus brandeum]|uniref:6-phosphogluconolactonase n=1 Tax=Thiolapillus brandeum TaxID=1076588 RepID=A0A7U6GJ54_9GAMM|nr:6-phosphogluconolactonase [Thiolapillus brandeum]
MLADAQAVAREAVARILESASGALKARGVFRWVLAGGGTPRLAYELLVQANRDWRGWQFYLGDERCLPPDDPERNSRMLDQALFRQAAIEQEQIHMIPAQLGAETGAAVYAETIRNSLPFDLVLLGLGEDGHTASLFPGHEYAPDALVVPVHDAPKPPPDRISLGYGALSSARQLLFLVNGTGKHPALSAWRAGKDIPPARIAAEDVQVLADQAAANG